jgi:hypothetical protein
MKFTPGMSQPDAPPPESAPTPTPAQSISAAGQAFQLAMQTSVATPTPVPTPIACPADLASKDVVMSDSAPDGAAVCPFLLWSLLDLEVSVGKANCTFYFLVSSDCPTSDRHTKPRLQWQCQWQW